VSLAADLRMYGRFAGGLRRFLAEHPTLNEARAIVRRRLATREEMFLRIVERGVYGHPASPYLPLLRRAGCELGDVRSIVRDGGVEGALRTLRDADVYVTFDEFKGRVPIERAGLALRVAARDFDNPFASRDFETQTSGSTGAGTRILYDLEHLAATLPVELLAQEAHGLLGLPACQWRPILPAGSGIRILLRSARIGNVVRRWWTPVLSGDLRVARKYRVATAYVLAVMRAHGIPAPRPEPLRMDQAEVVARWAADTARAEGGCVVRLFVSMALRVAIAAREAGLDLTGVTFAGGGEPPSPAKVRGITSGGARYVANYGMSECGGVGKPCARPLDATDVHFCADYLALIQEPKRVGESDAVVDAFCVTTLLPSAPKIMLNVESDDYGIVETRSCGCPLGALGYDRHIRQVRSFKKLTGEGMTLVGTDMLRVLEEVLPARFGGTALDYQLEEEEDEGGFTRMTLIVHPRVELVDEQEPVRALLESLTRAGAGAEITRAVWAQAETFRVRRAEPVWTGAGKLMPFRRTPRT
jgi:hypothetical protein